MEQKRAKSPKGNRPPKGSTKQEPMNKPPKTLMDEELKEFEVGPLSVLTHAVRNRNQVLIYCRDNHKLLGRVVLFDKHCNMVLVNVLEMWTETPRSENGKKKGKPVNKEIFISKMLLRGDMVVLVLKNAAEAVYGQNSGHLKENLQKK